MRLVVCIKQVPIVSAMRINPETKTLERGGVRSEVSAFDLRAVIKAVELRRLHGGEVIALTMGPPQAREALIECLALGADRAAHLCDPAFAGADTLATAEALAAAVRHIGFDLILCGRNSTDAETGQIGPELAELLGLPQVTGVRTLEIDPQARTLQAERETDDGFETVTTSLPALLTAAEDLAAERFPSKAERAAAGEKPIQTLDARALGGPVERFGASGSPTRVIGLYTVEEERAGKLIESESVDAAVEELVEILVREGLFRRNAETTEDFEPSPAGEGPRSPAGSAGDVLVVAEVLGGVLRPVTLELLAKAEQLATQTGASVSAALVAEHSHRHLERLAAHGASRIFLADGEAPDAETWTAILEGLVRERQPRIVLFPSTAFGRDVAPRLAARLRLGLTSDCIDLGLDAEGHLLQHKPAFGGKVVAPIVSSTQPEMATVRPGMLAAAAPRDGRTAEVIAISLPSSAGRVRMLSRRPGAERASALDHAPAVVGVGMGIGGPENLPIVEELASALGGALCTTRDVTDRGWLPKQFQVGLTGRAIAPRVYVAVGIRGAFEHLVGVRRAGLIVAINKNPKAPIFRSADYGIVADFAACVPELTRRAREARAAAPRA